MGAVDFDGIFNTGKAETKNSRFEPTLQPIEDNIPKGAETRPERRTEARTRLQREADRRTQERERHLAGIAEYQDSIKRAGSLRAEILKGIQAGEDTAILLLKACEAIAKMTGDETYYRQAEKNIQTVYGIGAHDEAVIKRELQKARDRFNRIQEYAEHEEDAKNKRRLQHAIEQHRKYIINLEESLRE